MSVNDFDIKKVADLARLELTPEEEDRFGKQLKEVLSYMDKLNEINTEGVEPLHHVIDIPAPMREDVIKPSLDREKALLNAPSKENGFFKTPKVKD
ncbi:MAG: Asp-tRNA(Asn)/Glu-tRNA(Gln) amidotransferase subunit GatC [bacterium]|nr:Asp-tRNA(Asn)/Glu-tRNA(Gln) amidotransferase subunit GatC [bacterium]